MEEKKKRFFINHSKSSALVVSLTLHAILAVVAISYVTVTVITKDEKKFEAKQVLRPKMPPKRLQVPVKVKKQRKPKLRQRIVVKQKMVRNIPDIKMPEISGIKGGLGAMEGAGLGGVGGVGFAMPEINLFGIKSKGEKVFLILDASPEMMYDEMGGIPAYTIIKQELIRLIDGLPPTTLFNVAVYSFGKTQFLSSSLIPASDANVKKAKDWLDPLNAVRPDMGAKEYGLGTLGPGGVQDNSDILTEKLAKIGYRPESWFRAAAIAMKQQADTVFILAKNWKFHRVALKASKTTDWDQTPAGRKWAECYRKGKEKLKKENEERAKHGLPPRVLEGPYAIIGAYFSGIEQPPEPEWYFIPPKDLARSLGETRNKFKPKSIQTRSGMKKQKKNNFSLNVVSFVEKGEGDWQSRLAAENYPKLASSCRGQYKTISGLDAIKSFVPSEGDKK
jgi:hypothetical protein